MNTVTEPFDVGRPLSATPALEIRNLKAWYGESHILHDVNLTVNTGEVVTLLGCNGAGRTTTLRAIMGLTGRRTGSIKVNGVESIGLPTFQVAHLGVGYCPEERGIFSSLTSEENLMLPPAVSKIDKAMSPTPPQLPGRTSFGSSCGATRRVQQLESKYRDSSGSALRLNRIRCRI